MINAELISGCTNYLRQNEYRFKPMSDATQEAIANSFLRGFEVLSPDQKTSITHKLIGLSADIRIMVEDHPLRTVMHDRLVDDIVHVLETAGVVESAKPEGLQRCRQYLLEGGAYKGLEASLVSVTGSYLDLQDKKYKEAKGVEERESAVELLNISSGIRFELARLGLVDQGGVTVPAGYPFESDPLLALYYTVRANILNEGLIGFTTLTKVIENFRLLKNTHLAKLL